MILYNFFMEQESHHQDLGTIPDISVPLDWLIWRSNVRAGILIDLPAMHPRFSQKIADQISLGLKGRGICLISERGRLFAGFGVTEEEASSETMVIEYGGRLLHHLGLGPEALLLASIDKEVEADDEVTREADEAIARLGIRAVKRFRED
jgi:hypothetical protein